MAVSIPHVCEFWYTAIFGPVKCTSLIICQGQLQRRKNVQIVQKVLKVRGRAGRWSSRSRSKSSIRRSSRGSRSIRRRRGSMRAWDRVLSLNGSNDSLSAAPRYWLEWVHTQQPPTTKCTFGPWSTLPSFTQVQNMLACVNWQEKYVQ